jgi:probable phosphoglycerate mutase
MIGSWTDWELTETGKQQAENIGRNLSDELAGQNYKIYSSDLLRARQTAEPLARYMKLPIEFREELREINYGESCGMSKAWAKENKLPVTSFDDLEYRGAESWRAFWNRVVNIFNEIMTNDTDNIIIVSHAGTIKVWQEIWSNSELQEYTEYGKSGGVSFFQLGDTGERMTIRLNDISYKEDMGRHD